MEKNSYKKLAISKQKCPDVRLFTAMVNWVISAFFLSDGKRFDVAKSHLKLLKTTSYCAQFQAYFIV